MEQLLSEHRELKSWEQQFLMVFAPAIQGFVEWVIESAIRDGKSRLYFLARDGYLMYQAAKHICEYKSYDIELRYLKVSRYALRRGQYHLQGEACLDYICTGGIDITFEKIMKRAGVSEEIAKAAAKRAGYEACYQEILTYPRIQKLKAVLYEDKELLEQIYEESRKHYPEVIGYLKQEGLLEQGNYGIVDTGWIGTLQKTLEQLIMSAIGGQEYIRIDGYYFGLYELPSDMEREKYQAYYFAPVNHIKRKVYFVNSLMEAVISAPEGMTIGYRRQKQKATSEYQYETIETEVSNPNAVFIQREAELLELFFLYYKRNAASSKTIEKLFRLFMATPLKVEVEFWGEYQFCDDILEGQLQSVAAHLSVEEIRQQWFWNKLKVIIGWKKVELHDSAWMEGSIMLTDTAVRKSLRQIHLYRYILYMRKAWKSCFEYRSRNRIV